MAWLFTQATASTAWPWAIILLPLRDARKANQRAGGDGWLSARFAAGRLWPGTIEYGRWGRPLTGCSGALEAWLSWGFVLLRAHLRLRH